MSDNKDTRAGGSRVVLKHKKKGTKSEDNTGSGGGSSSTSAAKKPQAQFVNTHVSASEGEESVFSASSTYSSDPLANKDHPPPKPGRKDATERKTSKRTSAPKTKRYKGRKANNLKDYARETDQRVSKL
jgi:hypothetical protein